jgi:hypothetical protein
LRVLWRDNDRLGSFKAFGEEKATNRLHQRNPQSRSFLRPCNQSKGASDWREWMMGKARGSPTTRNVTDVHDRMGRLSRFEAWGNVRPIAFEGLISKAVWDEYWSQLDAVLDAMRIAQEKAAIVRDSIMGAIGKKLTK